MTGRGRTRSYGQDACETTANASERPRTYCSALQAANHWLALASIGGRVERAMGIEPTAQAWEAWVLPLYDARSRRLILDKGDSSRLSSKQANRPAYKGRAPRGALPNSPLEREFASRRTCSPPRAAEYVR